MLLRKYFYIDENFVNDAFATIHGYDYNEKNIEQKTLRSLSESDNENDIKNITSGSATTISASLPISSKLQDIIQYLENECGGNLPFYESISCDENSKIKREYYFEGQFNIEFTKIERLGNLATGIQKIDSLLGTHKTDGLEGITQIQQLAKQERHKGLPCILSFVNHSFVKCYAYLDESWIRGNKMNLITEATILCKVIRIIKPDEKICLTDLSEYINMAFPDTPEGKRNRINAIKNGQMEKIKELEDQIEGPAIEVLPIAIYK